MDIPAKRESDTRFLTSGFFQDIRNFVSIAGIYDTGEKLFTGVNDTGKKLSLVLLLPAINYW
jgi:hypothetical protein